MSILNPELRQLLEKQKYQLSGKSIAVKKCLWNHNALRENRLCYKHHYGIDSHRCVQSTPTMICNHECLFCWRVQASDMGIEAEYDRFRHVESTSEQHSFFDPPEKVADELERLYRRIIAGYKPFVSPEKYDEAWNPAHITLSLAGEPLIYPWIPKLVEILLKRGKTVFIVTNGTIPERISEMIQQNTLPTQLYVTLPAPDEKTYRKTCRPLEKGTWNKIVDSLDLISEIDSRTVTRLTVAKNVNMTDPGGYSELINRANSSFVEVKGVVVVGGAMKRIKRETMPNHVEIMDFARKIEQLTDYRIVAEQPGSKVAILSNNKQPLSFKDK